MQGEVRFICSSLDKKLYLTLESASSLLQPILQELGPRKFGVLSFKVRTVQFLGCYLSTCHNDGTYVSQPSASAMSPHQTELSIADDFDQMKICHWTIVGVCFQETPSGQELIVQQYAPHTQFDFRTLSVCYKI